jgi:hypothetical protein
VSICKHDAHLEEIVPLCVRFQVLTAASMMTAFWDTEPCDSEPVARGLFVHHSDDGGSMHL